MSLSLGDQTLLHIKCGIKPPWRSTDVSQIAALIERGADVHARDINGSTPLHCSADVERVELLVKHGASVNAQTNDGSTWLHLMINKPYGPVWATQADLEKLDALGFDFGKRNQAGQTVVDIVPTQNTPARDCLVNWLQAWRPKTAMT
jgi:ankyrin repeat protein